MLAAIATASAGQSVERLVEVARAQAEAEVTDLIKSAIKASLLREAVLELESKVLDRSPDLADDSHSAQRQTPQNSATSGQEQEADTPLDEPDSPPASACYLYAITSDLPYDWSSEVPAVDAAFPLEVVRHRELRAVVSDVPLSAFSQAALDERLGDRGWVEEKVRAHDHVVKTVASVATAIPCRFCTIVRGHGDVRSLLAAHYQRIIDTLATLHGREEWGVRIVFDPTAIKSSDAATPPEPSGKQYLQRRKQRDSQRAQTQSKARELAQQCHASLAGVADETSLLSPRSGKGQAVEMLNAAYLVSTEQAGQFHQTVAHLRGRYRADGLDIVVTGPWPPYNFVQLDLSLEAAA